MANKELEQMLERVHKDIDIFDFDGKMFQELFYLIDNLTI